MNISLVVPIKNEANSIEHLLDSIAAQVLLPAEVVLVDAGSTDSTVSLIEQWQRNHPISPLLRVITSPGATPGKGRNVGITAAQYDWIALTDAGVRLEPNWLKELAAVVHGQPEVQVVYGNFEADTKSFFERCAALAYLSLQHDRPGGRMRGPCIPSSLLRREVWAAVGGFPDLRAAEDLIFMERIMQGRFNIGWAPQATIWWQLQPTLGKTFHKFTTYSRANVIAGRQQHWQYGVARQYAIALCFILFAALHNHYWIIIPVVGGLLRVAKSIRDRSEDQDILHLLNPLQFLTVALIIFTIDIAAFVGWLQALSRLQKRL